MSPDEVREYWISIGGDPAPETAWTLFYKGLVCARRLHHEEFSRRVVDEDGDRRIHYRTKEDLDGLMILAKEVDRTWDLKSLSNRWKSKGPEYTVLATTPNNVTFRKNGSYQGVWCGIALSYGNYYHISDLHKSVFDGSFKEFSEKLLRKKS